MASADFWPPSPHMHPPFPRSIWIRHNKTKVLALLEQGSVMEHLEHSIHAIPCSSSDERSLCKGGSLHRCKSCLVCTDSVCPCLRRQYQCERSVHPTVVCPSRGNLSLHSEGSLHRPTNCLSCEVSDPPIRQTTVAQKEHFLFVLLLSAQAGQIFWEG